MMPEVTVVVPVYRNRDTLRELHGRLCAVFQSRTIEYQILFVDDACPENSLSILQDLARQDPRVAVVVLDRNVGQHRAVLTGLQHASGKFVVIMDADLQDPPESIPSLLSKMKEGYAAVFAGRRGRYESSMRLLTSRVFKTIQHWLCGVPSDAGMFVVMDREMVKRLLDFKVSHPFVVAMIGCSRLNVTSIPVDRHLRQVGSSAYSSIKRLRIGLHAVLWILRRKLQEVATQ